MDVVSPALVVVLYLRVSTEEQGKKGYSLPEQHRECQARVKALASDRNVTVAMVSFEDMASGEVEERPGLEAMRHYVRRNRVNYVVCLDPDRFSRSLNLQLLVADEIEKTGARLVFVQHNYEHTPEGRLFFQMRGAISEFEKAKILERSKRGRRGKLAAGGIPNHISTWGYRWNAATKTLEIDPEAAPWVRQIFHWYTEDWSYVRIANELDRLGVKPPRGANWHKTSLMRMLQNSTYAGRLILNRWDCAGNGLLRYIPKEKRPRSRTDRIKPPEEWVEVQVPAIIGQALWEKVRNLHEQRTHRMNRGVGLLSGLCTCGLCGGRVHYVGDPKHRYLRCQNRYPHLLDRGQRPPKPCAWRDIQAAGIEKAIWQRVARWLTDPDALRAEQGRQRTQRQDEPDPVVEQVRLLERVLAERRAEQQRVYRLYMKGIAPAGAEADLERLAEQVRSLEVEVTRLQAAVQPAEPQGPLDLDGMAEAVQARLEALDHHGRQRMVRMLLNSVVVWPDGRFEYELR